MLTYSALTGAFVIYVYFSEEDSDYIHSYEQQGIDDVKEALAEWDAIAS